MDSISEARLSQVMPALAVLIRELADRLEYGNITIRVTQGLRTFEEQNTLFDQGRILPGKIVTNAKGGYSWHEFAMAVDIAPFDGSIPDWNESHPVWAEIIKIGTSLGLINGSEWHDDPHFQIAGPPNTPTDEDRALLLSDGFMAVWKKYGFTVA